MRALPPHHIQCAVEVSDRSEEIVEACCSLLRHLLRHWGASTAGSVLKHANTYFCIFLEEAQLLAHTKALLAGHRALAQELLMLTPTKKMCTLVLYRHCSI